VIGRAAHRRDAEQGIALRQAGDDRIEIVLARRRRIIVETGGDR